MTQHGPETSPAGSAAPEPTAERRRSAALATRTTLTTRAARMLAAVVVSAACATGLAQTAETCLRVTEAEVAALFERWNDALATGDPERVAELYAPGAVLLPTMSNVPRDTPAAIADYFVHFLSLQPDGRIEWRSVWIGCNVVTDAGLYTFATAGGDVRARYTFVYVPVDGTWLISHHHSSGLPEH